MPGFYAKNIAQHAQLRVLKAQRERREAQRRETEGAQEREQEQEEAGSRGGA